MTDAAPSLEMLGTGGKRAIARALSTLDRPTLREADAALLDAAFESQKGRVLGLTGPPGVGKSTLLQALIGAIRAKDQTLAVIAVDPSSHATGGALLGDRTRLSLDPEDGGLFVRSLAARDRLGGLSHHAIASTILLRALFDMVLVETVGIGQSEADIRLVADQSILCVQPGSGDALQFMKAGIMEWPDLICVTKSDMGRPARRAVADVEGALGLASHANTPPTVLAVSAKTGEGMDALVAHALALPVHRRADQAQLIVNDAIRHRFGTDGVERLTEAEVKVNLNKPFHCIFATNRALSRSR
ncbi:MAG: ATP-binding cassette domain-containing protein [Pseudomonadota bacterium]